MATTNTEGGAERLGEAGDVKGHVGREGSEEGGAERRAQLRPDPPPLRAHAAWPVSRACSLRLVGAAVGAANQRTERERGEEAEEEGAEDKEERKPGAGVPHDKAEAHEDHHAEGGRRARDEDAKKGAEPAVAPALRAQQIVLEGGEVTIPRCGRAGQRLLRGSGPKTGELAPCVAQPQDDVALVGVLAVRVARLGLLRRHDDSAAPAAAPAQNSAP
eukprot:scaffold639_cov65-Phaeocystis_antarctica.AAC.5